MSAASRAVGCFFLWTSGIHVGIVAADPSIYRHFADGSLVPGLHSLWTTVFMAHPVLSGLTVALGECAIALALLIGRGGWRAAGWAAALAFQVALMCFGWGFWLWSLPALLVLVLAARADGRATGGRWSSASMTVVDAGQ